MALAATAVALGLFARLDAPLFWADEAETAMFAQRVLEYGYPKVHGTRNVVYQFGPNIALGVKEGPDAYIGTTWGQFYFAAPGVAWAAASEDFATRTARARLPFALAGALGIGFWLAVILPLYAAKPRRAAHVAALFLLGTAVSVSLLLHLREVRYYALVVLLAGALVREHALHVVYGRASFARFCGASTLLLTLTFHVFFQAFFAFGLALGGERLWAVLRGRAPARDLLPYAITLLLVAPALWWFETLQTAARFGESFALGPADVLSNAGVLLAHLARHEFLVVALLLRALAQTVGAGDASARRVAGGLVLFAAVNVAVAALNPLPLERYVIVVGPALLAAMIVDAVALVGWARARWPSRKRAAGLAAGIGVAVLVLLSRVPGGEVIAARAGELFDPARGPIDFAVPALAERFRHPEDLVIATNYEEYAFMYYLRSHVIVGLSGNNLRHDQGLVPDVVIPRRRWPASLDELRPFLRRGDWEELRLPVQDVHFNNVPALSASRFLPAPHRFETPRSDDPAAQLTLYFRRSNRNATGSSRRP